MIGILGGTFDPVHYGHLRPADEVRRTFALEEIRIVPAGQPPHRRAPLASGTQRVRMVELALAEFPGFMVDTREVERAGISYTVHTLESLRAEFPKTPLCLLVGSDTFNAIEAWHQWRRVPDLAHLIVMYRPGWPRYRPDEPHLPAWARTRVRAVNELAASIAGNIFICDVTPQNISATRIRAAIGRGEPCPEGTPPAVCEFIREQGLYGSRAA